jgi:hypothetical protein
LGVAAAGANNFWYSTTGTGYDGQKGVSGAPDWGVDDWFGFLIDRPGGATHTYNGLASTDGVTWTNVGGGGTIASAFNFFDSTASITIGGLAGGSLYQWDGRIYSVEMRTGVVPGAGSVVWRFDAEDYPGTGTSYVDPRGRTWTLTTASAINRTADISKWFIYERVGDMSHPEASCVVPANVRVSGGRLFLDAKLQTWTCRDQLVSRLAAGQTPFYEVQTFSFTAGHLSQKAPSFLYGTIDFRAKVPIGIHDVGPGTWPCMWMLGNGWQASQPYTANTPPGYDAWPTANYWEIDVAEFMDNARTNYSCTMHYSTQPGLGGGNFANLPYDPTTRFMVYRLKWEAGRLRFMIDPEDGTGFQLMAEYTGFVPNTSGYVTINHPTGGKGGTINGSMMPVALEIDYVRITQP